MAGKAKIIGGWRWQQWLEEETLERATVGRVSWKDGASATITGDFGLLQRSKAGLHITGPL